MFPASSVKDSVVTGVLLALAATKVLVDFRFNGSLSKINLLLLLAGLVSLGCAAFLAWRQDSRQATVSRISVLSGLGIWATVCLGSGIWVLGGAIAASCVAGRLPDAFWRASRRAICVGTLLWSVTPFVVAPMIAPQIRWLDSPSPAGTQTTIFLLLDEFSAKSAGPVESTLIRAGVNYKRKDLTPFGPNTINVVPAIFTGRRFDRGSVCDTTSICSGRNVLDFSRIRVMRPEVDLVGAAMPYCAIRGLRYCEAIPFFDHMIGPAGWLCAVSRRWAAVRHMFGGPRKPVCMDDLEASFRARTEEAIWRAPVWRQGGMLYAHLLLPHPPGLKGPHLSLASDYAVNVEYAAAFVQQVVQRLQATHRPFRLVIFSDHPLRRLHCKESWYNRSECLRTSPFDDRVPLFVAGDIPPAFEAIQNNVDIFRLAAP